jgi:hypothetical protein
MNIDILKKTLIENEIEELGIPYLGNLYDRIFQIAVWATQSNPKRPRQLWFGYTEAQKLQAGLPDDARCRIIPMLPERVQLWMERGPFDALLLPAAHNPNATLGVFWKMRGEYRRTDFGEWNLWIWKSNRPALKLFALDHHPSVIFYAKRVLRPLGIKVDFTWLADRRPPINDAIPSQEPPFMNSPTIYDTPYDMPLDFGFKSRILAAKYDGVLTSHSLVTTYRLKDLGLPHFHINSTRFGNGWITNTSKHQYLVEEINKLFEANRLKVINNNLGDQKYLKSYFPNIGAEKASYIPSLCESPYRIRAKSPETARFLIWDPRQVLIKQETSMFMKDLYLRLYTQYGQIIESQAILISQRGDYLPEGYLDAYTAIIHVPYNISTMSIFEQTAASIPVWIPSRQLLKKLWSNLNEPNELSWTVFDEDVPNKNNWENGRDPTIIDRWIENADFYQGNMKSIITFDSIEDIAGRILGVNYNQLIKEANAVSQAIREDVTQEWESVFR